jgi:hypothetical protein
MARTVIHLASEELAWLRRKAKTNRVSPEKLVRGAIQRLRAESPPPPRALSRLLAQTRGLWRAGEGLAYQRRLRREWDRA